MKHRRFATQGKTSEKAALAREPTSSRTLFKVLFVVLAAAALTPWATAPIALVVGILWALWLGNPFPTQGKVAQKVLLQLSVVGLGATMNLGAVLRVGAAGALQTAIQLALVGTLTWVLTRALRTDPTTSLLIGVGTAICGGSAIAAVAPAIGAKSHQTSVALAVVFLLNAVALLVFPPIGHAVQLAPGAFGLWSALAIHDTSSVVGASLAFGDEALAVGTTVKLTRALWIIPVTIVVARVWSDDEKTKSRGPFPWFIVGFVALAALVTWVPSLQPMGTLVATGARRVLVLTLFLVGAGVSREAIRQVGWKPIALGVVLWLLVATSTLAAIWTGAWRPSGTLSMAVE